MKLLSRTTALVILRWAARRAAERSTWAGLAAAAAAMGYSVTAQHLTSLANILPMILGAGGVAAMAASTSNDG